MRAGRKGRAGTLAVTPEEFADRHPRLYHVTTPGSVRSIGKHGLLSTSALLDLFEINGEQRADVESHPRAYELTIAHPVHGTAVISDNSPLAVAALERCLDDGLKVSDWLGMLNERVFLWADGAGLARLLGARINRFRPRDVLVLDTLSLARALADQMEIAPINTGSAIRRPARRGLSTFTPIQAYSYQTWRGLRGRRDRVVEVTVRGRVNGIHDHLIDVVAVG
jgi:hypothetical protein